MKTDLHKLTAQFITGEDNNKILFKSFSCKNVSKATVFVTALGLFELKLNGKKVGIEYLTPYFDDYEKTLQVMQYDVTFYLQDENIFEIEVADGWCCGRFGLDKKDKIYADKPAALLSLVIEEITGNVDIIETDATWSSKKSKTISSGIYDGEKVDLTLDNSAVGKTYIVDFDKSRLIPALSLPVTLHESFDYSVISQSDNEFLLDFGQNVAGIVQFNDKLSFGQTVKFTHGEILQNGFIYTDNLRSASGVFEFTGSGSGKIITPKFTYFGFRYLKVEGVQSIENLNIKARALYSNIKQISDFRCNNENINKLISNVIFSLKSNSVDIPTDCPQRDERLGWTGDVSMFCKTASILFDMREFYKKYLFDVRNEQGKNGEIFNYFPTVKENNGVSNVWGDLICILPEVLFAQYGDSDVLSENFQAMKSWIYFVSSNTENFLVEKMFQFGDWLALDGVDENSFKGATDDTFIASVFYYNSVMIASKSALILGHKDDAEYFSVLCENIKNSIINEYFTPSGRFALDTQTALILSLYFEIYVNKDIVINALKSRLERDLYKLKTGFVGTRYILEVLAENDMGNIANEILFSEEYPGWLNEIKLGATTIWERWNSLSQDGLVSENGMNSFNHYAYGSVANYLFEYLAGIKVDDNNIIIKPLFDYRISKLHCSRNTPFGDILVDFYFEENGVCHFTCDIPSETSATLILPGEIIPLKCGENSLHFTVESFKNPYDLNTPFLFLRNNESFKSMLKDISPTLFGISCGNNMELLSKPFIEVCKLPFLNISSSDIDKIKVKMNDCSWLGVV